MAQKAKKGYLKVANEKIAKNRSPFVSLLIDSEWYSLFDSWWFGGKGSPYDIRKFADRDDPKQVVYIAVESKGFQQCTQIRPIDEKWQPEDKYEPADQSAKKTITGPTEEPLSPQQSKHTGVKSSDADIPPAKLSERKQEGLAMIAEAQEQVAEAFGKLADGIALITRGR